MISTGGTEENIDSLQDRIFLFRKAKGGILVYESPFLITYDTAQFGTNGQS